MLNMHPPLNSPGELSLRVANWDECLSYNRQSQAISLSAEEPMNRIICLVLVLATSTFAQQAAPHRPKITGIDHVDFYTTSVEANAHLYGVVLGLDSAPPIEPGQTQRFLVGKQFVGYSPAPDAKATDRMDHLAFATEDCAALRVYLSANGVSVPDSLDHLKDGTLSFRIQDPEGHNIEFVERRANWVPGGRLDGGPAPDPVSRHLIHAGFIVRDRAAEDHFYKDILGFHIYWHGGMKDGETDWAAMQVPDGTDWLEYMLNIEPRPDLQETGVQNHISLGVQSMKEAQAKLESHGWKAHDRDDHPEIGKDGKWQFDVFDPDYTRVELMEFKPVQKPCCSEFQGPHPSE
jgi:catechol 2,3-dioxygenase-like lactoylglutathione lyase family enzyme